MDDATNRLEKRRAEIERRLADIGVAAKADTTGAREQPALWLERAIIEQTLAQLAATEALRRDTEAREAERAGQDDAAFWWRRFNTSLAIGNGAGFVVVTGAILQSSRVDQALVFGWEFAVFFGLGVLCAGALPLTFWMQRRLPKIERPMRLLNIYVAASSAMFFALGVGFAVYRIGELQNTALAVAKAERTVEGAELAKRWKAAGLPLPAPAGAAGHIGGH